MQKSKSKSIGVQRIAIDRHFLDEVRTQLHTENYGKALTYQSSAPVEQHRAIEDELAAITQAGVLKSRRIALREK